MNLESLTKMLFDNKLSSKDIENIFTQLQAELGDIEATKWELIAFIYQNISSEQIKDITPEQMTYVVSLIIDISTDPFISNFINEYISKKIQPYINHIKSLEEHIVYLKNKINEHNEYYDKHIEKIHNRYEKHIKVLQERNQKHIKVLQERNQKHIK